MLSWSISSTLLGRHLIRKWDLILAPDKSEILLQLESTARYAGLLLAPAEGFGLSLGRGFFCPRSKKITFYMVCACFRPFLVFSSNLRNF